MSLDPAKQKFAMVSEWMVHGNINEFVEMSKGVNRVQLVSRIPYPGQPLQFTISAGRSHKWVGIHAQFQHGARRLERGTVLLITRRTTPHNYYWTRRIFSSTTVAVPASPTSASRLSSAWNTPQLTSPIHLPKNPSCHSPPAGPLDG